MELNMYSSTGIKSEVFCLENTEIKPVFRKKSPKDIWQAGDYIELSLSCHIS